MFSIRSDLAFRCIKKFFGFHRRDSNSMSGILMDLRLSSVDAVVRNCSTVLAL